MNAIALYQVAILALAVSAVSVTTAKSRMFLPVRRWIRERSDVLGDLASCHYCTSHWVAIVLVAIYRPVLLQQWFFVDLLVSVFAVVAIAAIIGGVIIRLTPFAGEDAYRTANGPEEDGIGVRRHRDSGIR